LHFTFCPIVIHYFASNSFFFFAWNSCGDNNTTFPEPKQLKKWTATVALYCRLTQKKQTKEKQKNIIINPLHRKDTFGNNKPKTWAGSE